MKVSLLRQLMLPIVFGLSLTMTNCASSGEQDEEYLEQGEETGDVEEYEEQAAADEELAAIDEATEEEAIVDTVESPVEDVVAEETEEAVVDDGYVAAETTETVEAVPETQEAEPVNSNGWTEETFVYTIEKGDTLSEIAQRVYGAASKWRDIAQTSSVSNPDFIVAGHTLKIPMTNDHARQFSATYTPTHTVSNSAVNQTTSSTEATELVQVIVKKGETLSSIAQAELGNSAAWAQIYQENKANIPDPNSLTVGQVLNVRKAAQAH